jgi:hypothetical protein
LAPVFRAGTSLRDREKESMRKITQGLSVAMMVLIGGGQAAAQDDPVAEFDELLRETQALQAYNALLQRQIETQQRRITELQGSIGQVPDLERLVPPLIERMVDGLEEFVELDIPFQEDERADRVAAMRNLVEDATVSDAEKFRRVLEAWEVENEYGRAVSAYTGTLDIGGTSRDVDFLQVGRVALLYQTQDLEQVGAWDPEQRVFVALGTEHRNSIRQAIRMANNAVAPDLVLLPIPAPE